VSIEIQPRFERSGEDSVAKEARAASVRWNVRPNGGETGGTILITSLLPPSLTHLSQHDRVVHKMVLRLVTQIVALCGVGVAAIARKSALAQLRVLLVKSLLYLGPALLLLALWLATPSCTWPSIPSSRRLLLLLLLTCVGHRRAAFEGTVNTVETTTDWTTRLPRCINGTRVSEPCTTLLYSPASVESVELVMRRLALQNELEFGRDVVGTSMNETQLQQYVLAHPNTTQGAVIFTTASSIEHPDEWHRELGTPDIRYQVFYNATSVCAVSHLSPTFPCEQMDNRLLVMQLAVDRALASLLADESTEARNNDYASSRSSRAIVRRRIVNSMMNDSMS